MNQELEEMIRDYIKDVIVGFESGFYQLLTKVNSDRISLLTSKHQPFITIFRDTHEKYFTKVYQKMVAKQDEKLIQTFDQFQKITNHSVHCLLNILANLTVSVHFNLDRKKLQCNNYDNYVASLETEIDETISVGLPAILKIFNHEPPCQGPCDSELQFLPDKESFIKIKMTMQSNGVDKEIHSFTVADEEDNGQK